jgi:hypothetical protein
VLLNVLLTGYVAKADFKQKIPFAVMVFGQKIKQILFARNFSIHLGRLVLVVDHRQELLLGIIHPVVLWLAQT